MAPDRDNPLLLAVDAGSPTVSVAVGYGNEILDERSAQIARSSGNLLQLVHDALAAADRTVDDIEGLLGFCGPGSFTGLRVGLATLLGLHQAIGVPATAIPTFDVLASLAPTGAGTVMAAVDALQDRWLVQLFRSGQPAQSLSSPQNLSTERLAGLEPDVVIGFGVSRLAALAPPVSTARLVEPPPLAAPAIRLTSARDLEWDSATLLDPLYLQPLSYKPLGE
jgi:tRNA threonylcarbamoyl adenosine modification protein YeaZ